MFDNGKYATKKRITLKTKPTWLYNTNIELITTKKPSLNNGVNQCRYTIACSSTQSSAFKKDLKLFLTPQVEKQKKQATTVASANSTSLKQWLNSGFFNNSDALDQTGISSPLTSNEVQQKYGAPYSKNDEVKLVTIGLASPNRIRQWAEKTLPNGKIVGEVTNANTLHHKTFKPQKGGLFCERIFGPLKDFQCACVNPKKKGTKNLIQNLALKSINGFAFPLTAEKQQKAGNSDTLLSQNLSTTADLNIQSSQGLGALQNYKRFFCPNCDVEYTWSVIRRYQLGYIQLNAPVTHVWYLKGTPSYISLLLDMKKKHVENVTYCTETLTLENSLKGDQLYNVADSPREIFAAWEKVTRAAGNSTLFSTNGDKTQPYANQTRLKALKSTNLVSPNTLDNSSKNESINNKTGRKEAKEPNTKNINNWLKQKNKNAVQFEQNSNIHKNTYYIGNSSETTVNILKFKQLASRKKQSTKVISTSIVSFVFNKFNLVFHKLVENKKKNLSNKSLLTDVKQPIAWRTNFINFYAKKSFNKTNVLNKDFLALEAKLIKQQGYNIVEVPYGNKKRAQMLNQKNSFSFLKYFISLLKLKQKNMQKIYAFSLAPKAQQVCVKPSIVNNKVDLTNNLFLKQEQTKIKFLSFSQKLKNKILHTCFDKTLGVLKNKRLLEKPEQVFNNYLESRTLFSAEGATSLWKTRTKKWSTILLIRTLVKQKQLFCLTQACGKQEALKTKASLGFETLTSSEKFNFLVAFLKTKKTIIHVSKNKQSVYTRRNVELKTWKNSLNAFFTSKKCPQTDNNNSFLYLDSKVTLKYFIQALMINRVLIWIKKTPFQTLFAASSIQNSLKKTPTSKTTQFYLQNFQTLSFCLPTVILFAGPRTSSPLDKNFLFFVGHLKQTNFQKPHYTKKNLSSFIFTRKNLQLIKTYKIMVTHSQSSSLNLHNQSLQFKNSFPLWFKTLTSAVENTSQTNSKNSFLLAYFLKTRSISNKIMFSCFTQACSAEGAKENFCILTLLKNIQTRKKLKQTTTYFFVNKKIKDSKLISTKLSNVIKKQTATGVHHSENYSKTVVNNIYCFSHRELWDQEKDWQFFALYYFGASVGPSAALEDIGIPVYYNRTYDFSNFGGLFNNLFSPEHNNSFIDSALQSKTFASATTKLVILKQKTSSLKNVNKHFKNIAGSERGSLNVSFSGAGMIHALLSEFDYFEMKKIDKQNRILLYDLNKFVQKLKRSLWLKNYTCSQREHVSTKNSSKNSKSNFDNALSPQKLLLLVGNQYNKKGENQLLDPTELTLKKYYSLIQKLLRDTCKQRDALIRRTKFIRKLYKNYNNNAMKTQNMLAAETNGLSDFKSKQLQNFEFNNNKTNSIADVNLNINQSTNSGSVYSSMILTLLPVLPPDLRPIVKMGNQIAASDLNRLYQRVIYRNDRFKKYFKDSVTNGSYEMKYAQRLLQEAVDNLIQNGKSGVVPEKDARGRALKSLSDLLKGKQGRFRQYLLGKRVDYSGRSVIVVGPRLKLHECGIPKEMALELYLPFLIKRILNQNYARTVVGAKTLIQNNKPLTWSLLREIMKTCPVLLNRAPTLHRLGFQAFQPKLIDGRAILLHPLVCPAFNADFDGDQMAVHVPISAEARTEAWKLMLSRNNLLSPATGEPLVLPSQDMVLGCYYLTTNSNVRKQQFEKGYGLSFDSFNDVLKAYNQGFVSIHSIIWVKWNGKLENSNDLEQPLEIRMNRYGYSHYIYSKSQTIFKYALKRSSQSLAERKVAKTNISSNIDKNISHNQNQEAQKVSQETIFLNKYIKTTPGKILLNLKAFNCA